MEKDICNTSQTMCPRCGYDLHGQVDAWHLGFVDWGNGDVREEDVGAKCPVGGGDCARIRIVRLLTSGPCRTGILSQRVDYRDSIGG